MPSTVVIPELQKRRARIAGSEAVGNDTAWRA